MEQIPRIARLSVHHHHVLPVHMVDVMRNSGVPRDILVEIVIGAMVVQVILPRIMRLWGLLLPAVIPQRNHKVILLPATATVRQDLLRLPTVDRMPIALVRNRDGQNQMSRSSTNLACSVMY